MKDLGDARQILGMQITCNQNSKNLWLSQQKYIKRFNMREAKPVSYPLGGHFKLSKKSCLTSNEEKKKMERIPCALAVGSLMYVMVCMGLYIAHVGL